MAIEATHRRFPEAGPRAGSAQAPATRQAPIVVQDFYPEFYQHCYGCGRLSEKGLHVRSQVEGDEFVARIPPCKDEVSRAGIAFAGHILSLLNCHAVAAAAAAAHRARGGEVGEGQIAPFMASGMKVEFVRPTPAGVPYEMRARALFAQRHKVIVKVELRAGNLVCARAELDAVEVPAPPGGSRRQK